MSNKEKDLNELSQYLTFVVDDEEYGVPILSVRGIQGWERTTPIPNSPDYIMGIINLRGEIVPIVDLRRRFNLEAIPYGQQTVVVVVRVGDQDNQRTVGLVVDAVADVHDIDGKDIRSTPEFGGKANNEFVRGLGLIGDKMVIILEIDQVTDWCNNSGGDIAEIIEHQGNVESETELEIEATAA